MCVAKDYSEEFGELRLLRVANVDEILGISAGKFEATFTLSFSLGV